MARLNRNSPVKDQIVQLAGKHVLYQKVLIDLVNSVAIIDPAYSFTLGAEQLLIDFDSIGIYDDKIWKLYSHFCEKNLVKTIAVVKAVKLGLLSIPELREGLAKQSRPGLVDEILAKIQDLDSDFDSTNWQIQATERMLQKVALEEEKINEQKIINNNRPSDGNTIQSRYPEDFEE